MKVIKEIFIYILLLALIVLILGIIFYDQLPSNKLVPAEVEYSLPEKLQEELDKTLSEDDQKEVLVTYTIDEDDLDKYEDNNQYNPGKIDPFADYSKGDSDKDTGKDNNNNKDDDDNDDSGDSNGGSLTETKPGK